MANYKVVDADQLNADLTFVADTIRESAGIEDKLDFPADFAGAVKPLVNAEDYLAAVHNRTISEIINHKMVGSVVNYWQQKNTSLTKVDLPLITKIGHSAFQLCASLADVNFPAATYIQTGAFEQTKISKLYCPNLTEFESTGWVFNSCRSLERVLAGELGSIPGGCFYNCSKLKTLVLMSDSVCTLADTSGLFGTPIAGTTWDTGGEMGYVYVPRSLLSDTDASKDYRRATNWSAFSEQFRAIEDFPEVLEGWE